MTIDTTTPSFNFEDNTVTLSGVPYRLTQPAYQDLSMQRGHQYPVLHIDGKPIVSIEVNYGVATEGSLRRAHHALKDYFGHDGKYNMLPDFEYDQQHSRLDLSCIDDGQTEVFCYNSAHPTTGQSIDFITVEGSCEQGIYFKFVIWDKDLITQCIKIKGKASSVFVRSLSHPFEAIFYN